MRIFTEEFFATSETSLNHDCLSHYARTLVGVPVLEFEWFVEDMRKSYEFVQRFTSSREYRQFMTIWRAKDEEFLGIR